MEITAGVILYLLATSLFIASGKFLKERDEEMRAMRRKQ
jgi:hypothetical protein